MKVSTRTLLAVRRAAVAAVAITATGLTVAAVDAQASDTTPATPTVGVTEQVPDDVDTVPVVLPPIDGDDCPACGLG